MKRAFSLILFLSFVQNAAFAQSGLSLQGGLQFGKMLTGKEAGDQFLYGVTLDVNKQTTGRKYWQSDHKFPQMGLQFTGRKFHSNQNLNLAFSVIPYLEFNVAKTALGILQIKHGTGLAFVSGDLSDKNSSYVGSRLNAATMLDLGFQFNTGPRSGLKVGAALSHISNGNLVQPNAGINAVVPYLQFVVYPAGRLRSANVRHPLTELKKWYYRIQLASGFHDYQKERNALQANIQGSLLVFYQHTTRFRTGMGMEAGALFQDRKWQPALYAEEEVLIGHLVTRYGLGCYLSHPGEGEGRLYEKVGIAWYPSPLTECIPKRLFLGMAIKAHGFRAAHIELSTGYLF